jgi:hypothetical protein
MTRAPLIALALFVAACEPVAASSYRGEPLGVVSGTIRSDFQTSPPPAEVILLFLNWRTDPGTVVASREDASGQFPAGFTMALYTPPPAAGLNTLPRAIDAVQEPNIGFAWIVVIRQGAAPPGRRVLTHADVKGLASGDVLGWAQDFVVAYLDQRAEPGTFAAQILGDTLDAGFHLMRAQSKPASDAAAINECMQTMPNGTGCTALFGPLVPADGNAGTPLEVTLTPDIETLRLPLFSLPPKVEQAFGLTGA